MDNLPYSIIRVCPEHLCKVFALHRIWERAQSGEFQYEIRSKRKTEPFTDHLGNVCTWNDNIFITDNKFAVGHHRHQIAIAQRHRTDDGTIGASGLWDPKAMMISDINYRKFSTKAGKAPRCQLCERGDMIPVSGRFYDSKYKPDFSRLKLAWRWLVWLPFRVMIKA